MALIRRTAWAAAAAVLCAASAGAATPEDARRAYDAGKFTDAMGIWAELSQQGSAEAAYGEGMMYDLGNGTPEDPATAFTWYKIAADAGFPAAEFNVAAMYDAGRGVDQDRERAAIWYAKAAARGHPRAEYNLGLLYLKGDGVSRNTDAASVWFHDAANAGIQAAKMRFSALETPGPRTKQPQPVSLVAPDRNVRLLLTADNPTVELVWTAPPEPWPAQYEIQVRELDGSSVPLVFTATVKQTATLVRLPMKAAFYLWDVVTVGPDGSRTAALWNWFSVSPDTQSLASAPH